MNIAVAGLWHLGSVTAACLAAAGQAVIGYDEDAQTVASLAAGQPPIFEPGLADLVQQGIAAGTLRFTSDPAELAAAELVWVAYDTPVDENDNADVLGTLDRIRAWLPRLANGTTVLISSQLPVGSTRVLEADAPRLRFAYSPENLRLGSALRVFQEPDRVVVGVRSEADRQRIGTLLAPITTRIEWMSVESAEMTKHALNAFLAVSVVFANEIATICEAVGADAKEVERGLKTEARIGPKAYLAPGAAFAGGTLARDVRYLTEVGAEAGVKPALLGSVYRSNDDHRKWPRHRLEAALGSVRGATIAVWGLAYKPGTDTLRRSSAVDFIEWIVKHGGRVQAHDPAVRSLPVEGATLAETPAAALDGADALVVATEWPEYRTIDAETIVSALAKPIVIDANRFLADTAGRDPRIRYHAVGTPAR